MRGSLAAESAPGQAGSAATRAHGHAKRPRGGLERAAWQKDVTARALAGWERFSAGWTFHASSANPESAEAERIETSTARSPAHARFHGSAPHGLRRSSKLAGTNLPCRPPPHFPQVEAASAQTQEGETSHHTGRPPTVRPIPTPGPGMAERTESESRTAAVEVGRTGPPRPAGIVGVPGGGFPRAGSGW